MLLSAVSVLVVAQSSSEIPEGLMNNPVFSVSEFHERIEWNNTFEKLMVSHLVMNEVYCMASQTSGLCLAILFDTCSSGSGIVIPLFF